MKSLRVVGPGWGYPLVFAALTIPAIGSSAQQSGGGTRALVMALLVALALFAWWRRGVWFANDRYLVVVNWLKRRVVEVDGATLELVPIGKADVSGTDFDPRRVRTMYLVAADGTRVRIRVVDGGSGRRIRRAVEAMRAVLDIANDSAPSPRRKRS